MRDLFVEAWLTKRKFPYEYVERVPLKQIHLTADALEQIRLGKPVDDDHVALIRAAMQDGADMPAMLVYRAEEPDSFHVLDGIHRGTAKLDLLRDTTDAYVVDVGTHDDVEIIRRTINVKNGKNLDAHARLEQAKYLKLSMGWTTAEVARTYGLSDTTVSTSLAADESLARVVELAGATVGEVAALFPTIALARLKEIKRDDMVQAIHHVAKRTQARDGRRLPGTSLEQLAALAKECVTDAQAAALIKRWATEYPTRKARPAQAAGPLPDEPAVVHRARREVSRFLTYIERHLVKPQLAPAQRKAALTLLHRAQVELAQKVGELERANGHVQRASHARPAGRRAKRPAVRGRAVPS